MSQKLDCAAFVGMDWGDAAHTFHVWSVDSGPVWHGEVEQQPEAIHAWVAQLRQRFGGRSVAVCLEQTRGALIFALMQHEFLLLCPINPTQLAAYRRALYPSGSKSDPTDAELAARFLYEHSDQIRVWRPDDEISRGLRMISEQRRAWVGQRVALENQLRQRLKETYPLALQLFRGDLHTEKYLAFLAKFPTLHELQRASPRQLGTWIPKHRLRADDPPAEELCRQQVQAIRQAVPLTKDHVVLDHARLVICHVVVQIRAINRAVTECDEKIAVLFAKHPDRELFASFPGAGAALAPRLAAAFGTDREKFQRAQDIQQMSGIAPVTRSSGKTRVVQIRWACPKFLRQTFHEFARCSTKCSAWAQAYLAMRQAAGTPYQVIIRALAFKWQRILLRCWRNRELYDERRYLERLRATGSNLIRFLPPCGAESP